jgi:hypothetical protein
MEGSTMASYAQGHSNIPILRIVRGLANIAGANMSGRDPAVRKIKLHEFVHVLYDQHV